MKKTIMLLSAPIGAGHMQAAKAIKQEFLKRDDVEIIEADVFDFVPGFFGRMLLSSYLFLLRMIPGGYDFLYKWGDKSNSLLLRHFVNWIFSFAAYKLIKEKKPDLVIATHVTPAGIISLYKKRYKKSTPLFGIVTDYAMHKWWIYNEIDAYIVVDKSIFAGYLQDIQPYQQIWDMGIPVQSEFFSNTDKLILKKQLGLDANSFICLLSGGGEGLLPMQKILTKWNDYAKNNPNIKFIAICGKNSVLQNQLLGLKLPYVDVLGFVDNVYDYMKVSDLMVSKAGGVSVTEAIVCKLPIVIYKPLPGQEVINTSFLEKKGIAVVVSDEQAICNFLANVDNEKLNEIKTMQEQFAKPFASKMIVDKINKFMGWDN